jgi:hypothetical protein
MEEPQSVAIVVVFVAIGWRLIGCLVEFVWARSYGHRLEVNGGHTYVL